MINILLVDDSETVLTLLRHLIESEKDMRVIGVARNGKEAIAQVRLLKPDIVSMDIQMPIMDGFEAIKIIMAEMPTPIIVISSVANNLELNTTYKALTAGALSVLAKPNAITSASFNQERKLIIDTLRSMAEIKVITHRKQRKAKPSPSKLPATNAYEMIAIGSSVGGPQALNAILSKLPENFPLPIVIVQHMTKGFLTGFTHWLNNNLKITVKTIEDGEMLKKGTVYFAPDDFHCEIARKNGLLIGKLVKGKLVSGFCPSATVLLQSAAQVCGKNAIGILLTGMGHDGADGLLELKKAHGHTLIQDAKSAVVFGMAKVAQSLGAVDKVVELDQIADYLIKITAR